MLDYFTNIFSSDARSTMDDKTNDDEAQEVKY